ncbi:MAG: rod shape-determining protein RodA [Legionellales bacterium]|nr:rod shape-determining protein RodA [Legionellales bacterium]
MSLIVSLQREIERRQTNFTYRNDWQRMHIDSLLMVALLALVGVGLVILYSAVAQEQQIMIRQSIRLAIAFGTMMIFAQISPNTYRAWAPTLYFIGIVLLLTVLLVGTISKGAQRWLDLGFFRFQPSEIMKLAVPLIVARYLGQYELPPKFYRLIAALTLIAIPGLLIIKQPDLGTSILVMTAGLSVILFAGVSWKLLFLGLAALGGSIPFLWRFLHDYQQERVLTFLNPERDPLGAGYHIIQSKIAIGSGGIFGKGWLNGSQAQLNFLPEHATDFIFAVASEEFGLLGCLILLVLYLLIVWRAFYIATKAQDNFSRLLASGLGLTFFISMFVNVGMVMGLMPVVGLPLPLVSYGGTSIVTTMAGFGIIMSIHTHRKFLPK